MAAQIAAVGGSRLETGVTALGVVFVFFVYSIMVAESSTTTKSGLPLRVEYGLFAITAAIGFFSIFYGIFIGPVPPIFALAAALAILDFLSLLLARTAPPYGPKSPDARANDARAVRAKEREDELVSIDD